MERTIRGYRYDDELPLAVGASSVTYRAVREGAADVSIAVTIKVIDLQGELEETGQRSSIELLDSPPLQHACVVDVRDVIRMGEGRVGIVRELVDGPSLDLLFDRLGDQPVEPAAAFYLARQCAGALAFAHGRNLLHCDFCHRHVLLSRDGQVKVSDFQVAGLLTRAARADPQLLAGKRFFLAPELWTGGSCSPEADVFALGVLLYRAVFGYYPFADHEALLDRLTPDLDLGDSDWGPPLARLLGECLSHEPELRPSAGELERRLRRVSGPVWPGYGGAELAEYLDSLDAAGLLVPPPVPALPPVRPPRREERTGTDPEPLDQAPEAAGRDEADDHRPAPSSALADATPPPVSDDISWPEQAAGVAATAPAPSEPTPAPRSARPEGRGEPTRVARRPGGPAAASGDERAAPVEAEGGGGGRASTAPLAVAAALTASSPASSPPEGWPAGDEAQARLARLEEQVGRLAWLEEQVGRLARLEEQVGRLLRAGSQPRPGGPPDDDDDDDERPPVEDPLDDLNMRLSGVEVGILSTNNELQRLQLRLDALLTGLAGLAREGGPGR